MDEEKVFATFFQLLSFFRRESKLIEFSLFSPLRTCRTLCQIMLDVIGKQQFAFSRNAFHIIDTFRSIALVVKNSNDGIGIVEILLEDDPNFHNASNASAIIARVATVVKKRPL